MERGLEPWHDFFTAEVGASAALAGFVIVAVSINLGPILKLQNVPGRAAESLLYLGGAMVAAGLALMPQSVTWFGGELAVLGIALWMITMRIQLRAVRNRGDRAFSLALRRFFFGQLCTLPIFVSGILFVVGGYAAPFILSGGIIVALAIGLTNTWVLLVEILR